MRIILSRSSLVSAVALAFAASINARVAGQTATLNDITKYTIHTDMQQDPSAAANPLAAMAAGQLGSMVPPGGADQIVTTSLTKGTRTEFAQGFMGVTAGTVTITKPDGSSIGMNPANKTYWKQPVGDAGPGPAAALAAMGITPTVKIDHPAGVQTIDGMKASHVVMTISMALPLPPGVQAPPGMPSDISTVFDAWMTDAVKLPAASGPALDVLQKMGLSDMKGFADAGFMLKGTVSVLGIQLVMTTKDISHAPQPAAIFDVPADYKEVPAPGGRGGH